MTQTPPPSPLLLAGSRKPVVPTPTADVPGFGSPADRRRSPKGYPYRLLLGFDPDPEIATRVLSELEYWLRGKHGGDPSLAESAEITVEDARVTIVHRPDSAGGPAFRFRHEHRTADGTWITLVAVSAPPRSDGWLLVKTSSPDGGTAAKPRFIDRLLEVLDLKDGDYPFSASTRLVSDEDEVEALVDAVCDPERQGLLFVAGTHVDSELSLEEFRRRLDTWTRRALGLAQSIILTPLATEMFNRAMSETHGVAQGTVRTYYRDVDPAVAYDATRHRILSQRRIEQSSDGGVRAILVPTAQRHASTRRHPAKVTQVLRALTRIEDRLFLSRLQAGESFGIGAPSGVESAPKVDEAAATLPKRALESSAVDAGDDTAVREPIEEALERPGPVEVAAETLAAETTGYLALVSVLARSLGLNGLVTAEAVESSIERRLYEAREQAVSDRRATESAHMEVMRARLDKRQERVEQLEDDLAAAEKALEDMVVDIAVSETERLKRADEVRWLRTRLHEAGAYESAWAGLPESAITSAPDSIADLPEAIDALNERGIYFSGDRDLTADLADQDTLETMVAAAWEFVLVMADYVRAKREGDFAGALKTFLASPPDGDYRTTTTERFGERESKRDMQQYGHLRVFPLPEGVERDGTFETTMEMHWKLPKCGLVTPRMHFLDSTGIDGNIYIGYCGPHLKSRRTN